MKLLKIVIPPIKLVALGKILKVNYNDKIPWDELCKLYYYNYQLC